MNIDGNQFSANRFCGLTLRELGAEPQAISYPAVSKAVVRLEQRLQRVRLLCPVARVMKTI